MSLPRGQKLTHYEILELIGKGGMEEVYRAKDGKLGRDVADVDVTVRLTPEDPERFAADMRSAGFALRVDWAKP